MEAGRVSASAAGGVYLVGAGPGAADLLTVRAARLLAEADVVLHDALVGADVLALALRARLIPVGKRAQRPSTAQRFIDRQLVDCARKYRTVVRLKGGDPMLFGRADEEMRALRAAGIAFEIVPGVSAAFAAAADLQVSLTRRGVARSVAFLTPCIGTDEAKSNWIDVASSVDTAVIYMAGRNLAVVAARLVAAGRAPSTPLAVVESASMPGSVRWMGTLGLATQWTGATISDGPVLIVVGDVMLDQLAAFAAAALLQNAA